MAEIGISGVDVTSLRETLFAQQKLLQKLYNELDVEREASGSAATEALSMILRLQGEKATVQMEAEQYKRLAEEKMCHAEEALAIFEDVLFQKEMEIAASDYQVQAYRHKLLSIGCTDPGGSEIKLPEHLLQLNESVMGDVNLQSLSRRNSAPLFPLKFRKSGNGRETSASPESDSTSKLLDEQTCHEMNEQSSDMEKRTESSAAGSVNSYWEQIRKLDERVKMIAGASYANLRHDNSSPSPFSQKGSTYYLRRFEPGGDLDQNKYSRNTAENDNSTEFSCSPNVLDVFEVPQTDKDTIDNPVPAENGGKLLLQGCNRLQRPDSIAKESLNLAEKEKMNLLRRLLTFPRQDNNLRRLSEVSANFSTVQPTSVADSETKLVELDRPSEITEVERQASCRDREDVVELLYEIKEQINLLHSEVIGLKTKKCSSSQKDDMSIVSLKEAMLHFWL